jgi:hypothetical protein
MDSLPMGSLPSLAVARIASFLEPGDSFRFAACSKEIHSAVPPPVPTITYLVCKMIRDVLSMSRTHAEQLEACRTWASSRDVKATLIDRDAASPVERYGWIAEIGPSLRIRVVKFFDGGVSDRSELYFEAPYPEGLGWFVRARHPGLWGVDYIGSVAPLLEVHHLLEIMRAFALAVLELPDDYVFALPDDETDEELARAMKPFCSSPSV